MIDSKNFTKEEVDALLTELHLLKTREKTCRPIALPENLTVSEFNWLLNFLKEQRKKFEEAPHIEVEPLKTLDF